MYYGTNTQLDVTAVAAVERAVTMVAGGRRDCNPFQYTLT